MREREKEDTVAATMILAVGREEVRDCLHASCHSFLPSLCWLGKGRKQQAGTTTTATTRLQSKARNPVALSINWRKGGWLR